MRRVVVTGMGMLSPFGKGVAHTWKNIIAGKSGIKKLQGIEAQKQELQDKMKILQREIDYISNRMN